MTYLPQRDIDTHEFGGEVKKKVDRPHYKEMYEQGQRKIAFQWRVIIGLSILSLALGSLAVIVMLNLK